MKISIITVTYNSERFINDCLSSVKSQKYQNIEHIIIDGASSDSTLQILKHKKHYLKYLISEPDKGMYHAMNKGIKIATGDIIGFLNSDDVYATKNIISQVANFFIKNKHMDACYGNVLYTNFDKSKVIRYWKSSKFMSGLFSKGWCPPHPTFFVRKKIYKKFGSFKLKYKIAADVELMMRFLEKKNIKSHHFSKIWVKMRVGGKSNKDIRNIVKQNQEVLKSLKNNNLSYNLYIFFLYKIIYRLKQFVQKPKKILTFVK